MDEWASAFMVKMEQQGLELHIIAKYVDDVNMLMVMMPMGSRWEGGKVTHSVELEQQDRKTRTQEEVTMELVRTIADSITPWLDFTAYLHQHHSLGVVPMLDLQV